MNTELAEVKGKVLFVDDEKNILSALKREFFYSSIEVFTAMTVPEAFRILGSQEVDVVVSDYRMPETDGMQFLQEVKEQYPCIARLVFSGFIDRTILMRSLTNGKASTFFTKPWNKSALLNKIQRIIYIKRRTTTNDLFSIINSIFELPTFGSQHKRFLEAVQGNQPRGLISQIVNIDPVLTSKVLQVANSAFFGEREITNVNEAIEILHITSLEDIAVSTKHFEDLMWSDEEKNIMVEIYTQSVLVNRYLPIFQKMTEKGEPPHISPALRLRGDMGKIVLLHYFPEQFYKVHKHQQENNSFYECELLLGYKETSHLMIGTYLLDLWNIPGDLTLNLKEKEDAPRQNLSLYFTAGLTRYLIMNKQHFLPEMVRFKPPGMGQEEFGAIVKAMEQEIHVLEKELTHNPYTHEEEES